MDTNTKERISFVNATAEDLNRLAAQYEPLINKLTNQYFKKVKYDWHEIKSMAYEGLALAIRQYDPERSTMTFTQFAAFSMRNNILTRLSEELRTVKMSAYAQQKATEAGESLFTSVSMTRVCGEVNAEIDTRSKEYKYELYESAKFSDGSPLETLIEAIKDNFNERDQDIFFSYFALGDYEELKVIELAKKYNVTAGRISQRIKRMVDFIKSDPDLIELLDSMLDK